MEKVKIPYSAEMEKAVLACMLIDREAAVLGCNMLTERSFYLAENKKVFQGIKSLVDSGSAVDVVLLSEKLNTSGSNIAVSELTDIVMSESTSVNIDKYIKVLQELEYRRTSISCANKIRQAAMSGSLEDIMSAFDSHEGNVIKANDVFKMTEYLEKAIKIVWENKKSGRKFTGLRTGFDDLDLATGGFQDSDLIVIAGRPSMGKTAFALDILKNSARELKNNNKIGLFFSLEMSGEQVSLRMFSSTLGINNERFRFGTLKADDIKKINDDSSEFEENMSNIYFCDNMEYSVQGIYTACHSTKATVGKEIGLIVIDYLQLIETEGKNRVEDISKITRGLKKMAKNFNCPVVVLSQLNRSVEQRPDKRPELSDLRESGSIEQDADLVLFLYRDEYYHPESEKKDIAEVLIKKQRNGSIGTVELLFRKEMTTFKNLAR
jgi:replicative DNA helicase